MGGRGDKSETAKNEEKQKSGGAGRASSISPREMRKEYKSAHRRLSLANTKAKQAGKEYATQRVWHKYLDKNLQKVGNEDYEREFRKVKPKREKYLKALKAQREAQRRYDDVMVKVRKYQRGEI